MTGTELVLTGTLFPRTENICEFFEEQEGRLPVFRGDSMAEHIAAWRLLNGKDQLINWRRAAIASSLERAHGQRTDCGRSATPIQEFCRGQLIGAEYVSRLARTYKAFDRPDDPGNMKLLDDPRLSFKHFMVAATCSTNPKVALIEALQLGWSANELARMLATRRSTALIDEGLADRESDDDDLQVRHLPERTPPARRPPKTRKVEWLLTKGQHRTLARQLRALSAALGTGSDVETVLAVVARAHAGLAGSNLEAA